jgi:hypothetical protein
MNNASLSGFALEKALEAKLREMLGQVNWLRGWKVEHTAESVRARFDLMATVPLTGGPDAVLCVECKSDFRPSQFDRLRQQAAAAGNLCGGSGIWVLAVPTMSLRVAELCAENGWGWFDLAGNCRIDIPGILHLECSGRPPVHSRPRPVANLSTREAGRVVRALLCPENTGFRWTQRHMVEHFKALDRPIPAPSLGLVNKVVRLLRDEAYIEDSPDGGFQLRDPQKLLFAWRDVYRFDRHKRLNYFSLYNGKKMLDSLVGLSMLEKGNLAYAAFSAAELQAPNVRQPKTWFYVREQALSAFERCAAAKQVDSGENLVVLIPDDESVFYQVDRGSAPESRLACTNAVQTYVDVWNCGGRGKEAAEAILEQCLRPAWRAKGISE